MEAAEPTEATTEKLEYQQIHQMVAVEFHIEEGFLEYNTPTFYVTPQPTQKQAFLRLYKQLNNVQLIPVLRKREKRTLLQVVPKPSARPSRPSVNLALLVATIGTTLISGYLLSLGWTNLLPNPWVGAVMFSAAVMSIFLVHEMGHKLMANKHKVEATYPYFIPGLPPIGTFGAVIQQKSLAPNRDALFDLGMSGPILGFVVAVVVLIIGIPMSNVSLVTEPPLGTFQTPLLFDLLASVLLKFPSNPTGGILLIEVHPVAYAGYIGMIVTMLNLMPIGQLDGGHIAYVLSGETARSILFFAAMISLLLIAWPMALIAFLLSRVRHPGPLDDVSKLSRGRKLAVISLVLIFILSVAPVWPLF